MTSLVCIWGDHLRPWVLSLSRVKAPSPSIPSIWGNLLSQGTFQRVFCVIQDAQRESLIRNVSKVSSQNQNQDVCGGVRSLHVFKRMAKDSLWKRQFFLFSPASVWLLMFSGPIIFEQRKILSANWNWMPCCKKFLRSLFPSVDTHISWHLQRSYLRVSIVWPEAPYQDANRKAFSIFNINPSHLPPPRNLPFLLTVQNISL